jgi:hypothetical protein
MGILLNSQLNILLKKIKTKISKFNEKYQNLENLKLIKSKEYDENFDIKKNILLYNYISNQLINSILLLEDNISILLRGKLLFKE